MAKTMGVRCACWVAVLAVSAPLHAQMHKVEKPGRVTRAVAVYEWTGELKTPEAARLIPVSLFIDSHFEDAGVYLARPVPFVLQTGDVYSVERAGESLGLLDVDYARNVVTRRSANDEDPVGAWYGYGKFEVPPPPKKSNLKPSAVKPAVDGVSAAEEDDQPHLAVRAGAEETGELPAQGGDKSGKATAKAGDAKPDTTSNPAPEDDPDRPTLRHRDPQQEQAKRKRERPSGEVIAMSGSLNDDPNRPILRRGVPGGQAAPDALTGMPPNLHQAVAVSDAAGREPHTFTREWQSSAEHAQALKDVEALARPVVAAYLAANKLRSASAADAAPTIRTTAKTGVRKPAVAPAVFALTNEQMSGYELSYGGLPTFVYMAEVPVAAGGPVYLTMVTQRLPAGEMQVALSSVTDATHLNRVPWMRPVDAVDPDWSHRASLLMELRAQSSRQFALYRIVTAKAEQEFVTGIIE